MQEFIFYFLFIIWLITFSLAIIKDEPSLLILSLPLTLGIGISFNTGIEKYYCFGFENVQNDTSDNTIECKKITYTSNPMAMFFYMLGVVEVALAFVNFMRKAS